MYSQSAPTSHSKHTREWSSAPWLARVRFMDGYRDHENMDVRRREYGTEGRRQLRKRCAHLMTKCRRQIQNTSPAACVACFVSAEQVWSHPFLCLPSTFSKEPCNVFMGWVDGGVKIKSEPNWSALDFELSLHPDTQRSDHVLTHTISNGSPMRRSHEASLKTEDSNG